MRIAVLRSLLIAALTLSGLVTASAATSAPVAADCASQPTPPDRVGVGYRGTASGVEEFSPGLFSVSLSVERTLAGPTRRTITFETADYADCDMIDGSAIHEGDELVVVGTEWWKPRTLAFPFAWRATEGGRWDLSVIARDNRRRLPSDLRAVNTYPEILAFIGAGLPSTDADPSPEASASPEPSGDSASPSPLGSPAPAALANAPRPLTLDELVVLLDVVGAPTTVVADVTVRRDVAVAGGPCPRRVARITGCRFGFIDGPSNTLIPVIATTRVAAGFRDGVEPSGLLAFRVDRDQLRLLGALTQPADAYTVPVTEQAMATVDGLPLNALIAVDGWLGVLGWGVPCPAYPGVLGRMGEASPFVRCPGGWITADDRVPAVEPGAIATVPDGFGIPVQAAAYKAFAPDPGPATAGATPARHATYLMRHVGNPESSVGPPMGWLVVGRVDPVDDTGAVLIPTASPVIGADPPLREPVVATGRKVPVGHRRVPDARGEQDGVVFELWLPQGAVGPGDWLAAHLRITNTRATTINIDCPPAHTRALTHRLFDPGRRWWSRGAAFKQAILGETWVGSVPFGSERNGVECPGSVGLEFNVRPGKRLEYDTFALPRALAGDQPLPAGMLPVRAELGYNLGQGSRRERSLAVQASVRLQGPDWPWATPVEMVDAALADPRFAEWIATRNRPTWWGDAEADPLGVAEWPEFGFRGPAPDGTIILSLTAGPPSADGGTLGRVLLDPWTAQVLGVDIGAE